MTIVRVDPGYRIEIPPELRPLVRVGDKIEVRTNADGSVMLILPRVVDEVLDSTAGIWADRSDIPTDGVEYVDALRSGSRLTRSGITGAR